MRRSLAILLCAISGLTIITPAALAKPLSMRSALHAMRDFAARSAREDEAQSFAVHSCKRRTPFRVRCLINESGMLSDFTDNGNVVRIDAANIPAIAQRLHNGWMRVDWAPTALWVSDPLYLR